VINNVVVYDWKNALSYSLTAFGFLALFFFAFVRLMDGKNTGAKESYVWFIFIILGLILLYLRWDGCWSLIKDLFVEPANKLKEDLSGDDKLNHIGVLVICIIISLILVNPGGGLKSFGYFMWNKNRSTKMAVLMWVLNLLIIFLNRNLYMGLGIFYIIYDMYYHKSSDAYKSYNKEPIDPGPTVATES